MNADRFDMHQRWSSNTYQIKTKTHSSKGRKGDFPQTDGTPIIVIFSLSSLRIAINSSSMLPPWKSFLFLCPSFQSFLSPLGRMNPSSDSFLSRSSPSGRRELCRGKCLATSSRLLGTSFLKLLLSGDGDGSLLDDPERDLRRRLFRDRLLDLDGGIRYVATRWVH